MSFNHSVTVLLLYGLHTMQRAVVTCISLVDCLVTISGNCWTEKIWKYIGRCGMPRWLQGRTVSVEVRWHGEVLRRARGGRRTNIYIRTCKTKCSIMQHRWPRGNDRLGGVGSKGSGNGTRNSWRSANRLAICPLVRTLPQPTNYSPVQTSLGTHIYINIRIQYSC